MAKDTRSPRTTAETVSTLEAARRSLMLQDEAGNRFTCPLWPFQAPRLAPDRIAEDWLLREMLKVRPWWIAAQLGLTAAYFFVLEERWAVLLLTGIAIGLGKWQTWRPLWTGTRGWRRLPRRSWREQRELAQPGARVPVVSRGSLFIFLPIGLFAQTLARQGDDRTSYPVFLAVMLLLLADQMWPDLVAGLAALIRRTRRRSLAA